MQIFIASVEWLLIANIGRFVMARSLLRRRGHLLASCHRERPCASWPSVSKLSSRTQCGDLLAMGLLLSLPSIASDKNRAASVELVSRLPRRVFYTARNDKVCGQVQGCHRERPCASWRSSAHLNKVLSSQSLH